jgi:hypothetical protein
MTDFASFEENLFEEALARCERKGVKSCDEAAASPVWFVRTKKDSAQAKAQPHQAERQVNLTIESLTSRQKIRDHVGHR